MPDGYVHRMQLNNASDLQYPSDFFLETQNNGDSTMENRMSLTKNSDNQHMSIDTSYYINMLEADPFANNKFAVHRLPELHYSVPNSRINHSNFLYNLDIDYTNFARSGQAWDTMNTGYNSATNATNPRKVNLIDPAGSSYCDPLGNNPLCKYQASASFDPSKDILRSGQRINAEASLLRPFRFADFFDVVPKISYHDTQYFFPISSQAFAARRFMHEEVSTRLSFSRVYDSAWLGRYKHEIQPELTASANSPITSPDHPFFGQSYQSNYFSNDGLSDLDLNGPFGIQFDYNDRLSTSSPG
jgi:LPS-assembly protein